MSERIQFLMNRSLSWGKENRDEGVMKLGAFCELKYGRSLPEIKRRAGNFPVYGSNGIVGFHDEPVTVGPAIIIGRKGSVGALQYSGKRCCPIDTTYYVDSTCTEVNLRWLFFMLQKLGLNDLNKHVAVPGLDRNDVYEKELLVPSSEEQRRIAAVLDKADALRLQRQESLQLIEKLLQSVFIDMFGDPVRNSHHLPTEELGQLAKLERGKFTPRPRNDPSYYGGQYPFIQTGDITRSNGRITTWTQTLNEKGAAVSKEFTPGTVVIAIVGATIGETAIVETPVYCPDSIIGITPYKDKATSEFIEFLLRLWKPRLKELAPDAARANLNLERLRPLPALAPSVEEQQEFSRIATMLRSLVLVKQESKFHLSKLFSSLQQCAFQGELDLSRLVLDSLDDEPVAAELQRPVAQRSKPAATAAFKPSESTEAVLKALDEIVSKGDAIAWSADYFKYRILGTQPIPFSFSEVMEKAESIFEDPPYEKIKDMILELLGYNGSRALLNQRFDLQVDDHTNEVSGRKEIVFEPA